ncbi:tyrosine-type recombinase/integrase [Shewanella glacialipiscicola]|uniref:tyrosine-type recombinase/integrase n=1 Tax=Shewanella glacialipiscicola TaxID=614069 RepID=UPI003D7B8647
MEEYNPGRKKGEPGKQGRAPVPSKRQFKIAMERCEGYPFAKRNQLLLVMMFALGLRPKEASSLLLGDIYNFKQQSVVPVLTLLKLYTKRSKVRQIPLNNETLIEHIHEYLEERKKGKARHYHESSPLFLSKRGGPFTANSLGNLMNTLLEKRANISRASSYSGRRYFATNVMKNGNDINTLRILMGHESLATTQRYIEGDPESMMNATKGVI